MRPVNLLPAEYRRERFRAPQPPVLVAALGAVVLTALLVGGFLVENAKVSDKQRTLQAMQADLTASQPPPRPSNDEGQLVDERNTRVTALNTALTGRVAWDRVLRNLSLVLPDDVWLQTLTASTPGSSAATTAPNPAGTTGPQSFILTGYTYSQEGVARLLARLAVVPDLTNVQLQKSESTAVGNRPVITFTIASDVRVPGVAS